jgi:hypothetical protein
MAKARRGACLSARQRGNRGYRPVRHKRRRVWQNLIVLQFESDPNSLVATALIVRIIDTGAAPDAPTNEQRWRPWRNTDVILPRHDL